MKVEIGDYPYWFGPYQLAKCLLFWMHRDDDRVSSLGDLISDSFIGKFLTWYHSTKNRKIKVKIERYDTWNMDSTLAHIVYPMLVQLKKNKHGSAFVDDADVPEELRGEEKVHEKWDYVLGEMIWSFKQHIADDNPEQEFFDHSDVDETKSLHEQCLAIKYDREGHMKFEERKKNGFLLFGKYYQSLWD